MLLVAWDGALAGRACGGATAGLFAGRPLVNMILSVWSRLSTFCQVLSASLLLMIHLFSILRHLQVLFIQVLFLSSILFVSHIGFSELPSTGSRQVHVFVFNFGSSHSCIRSTFGLSSAQHSMWMSDSSLKSRVAPGWGQALQLSVSSGIRTVGLSNAFSYGLARASSFPMNIPTSGSVIISVVGAFFVVESSASAFIGFSRCLSTFWMSSSAMFCRTASGLGAGNTMHFSLHARANLTLMSYDRIRLDSMVYSNASVLVNGSGFGREVAIVTERSLAPPTVVPAYGNVVAASLSLESRKSAYQLNSISVSVKFVDVLRLDDVTILLQPPNLLLASSLPLLHSRCFGCILNASSSVEFVFSDDALAEVPMFGCVSGAFKPQGSLKLKSLLSSTAAFGQWSLLITAGSSDLRIHRASIEFVLSSLKVSIGSTPVAALLWSSDSSISLSVAPGYGHSLNMSATSALQLSSNVLQYSYLDPVLSSLHPAVLSSTAAVRLLLMGSKYQVVDFSPRLRIGTACAASTWASDSVIACRLVSSRQADVAASVTLGLIRVSSEILATGVSVPTAQPASFTSTQVTASAIVSVYGKAFGTHSISARISSTGSAAPVTVWLSDSQLVAKSEQPSRLPALLVVSVCKVIATSTLDRPGDSGMAVAASCHAADIPASGSYVEYIYGINFGMHSTSSSAKLGGTAVERFIWISSSTTSCKLPSGSRTWALSGTGIIASFSHRVRVDSAWHAPPIASNLSMSVNETFTLHVGEVKGSGFGFCNPSPAMSLEAVSSNKTFWHSDSSMTIALNAKRISTDLLLLQVAISNAAHGFVYSSQVLSPVFVPKPAPLIQVLTAKVYTPIPADVLNRLKAFTAQGLAAGGNLPSPDTYDMPDVGFMEEVNVSAIVYNNGTQVFSKDLLPVSKPINGTFTVVDAFSRSVVKISCDGVETAFHVELIANTYAVSVTAGLGFCPSVLMRVAVIASFSIPGQCVTSFIFSQRTSCLCIQQSMLPCLVPNLTQFSRR